MKNPLTSKERRGLVAVAAAALLCVASGFIFRSCSGLSESSQRQIVVIDSDATSSPSDSSVCSDSSDSSGRSLKSLKSGKSGESGKSGKSGKSAKSGKSGKSGRSRAEKGYPSRSPLDEPCD